MRIRTKLISVYLGIAILFSLSGFYGVHYTEHVGKHFESVESDSVPSLISLMEITAATRQASIKAMEYSMRGRTEDRTKALEALNKIQEALASYKTTMPDQGPARRENLEIKIDNFIRVISDYLSLGTGPALSDLIIDVDKLHEFRSELIREVNEATQHESKQLELILQHIKSEARKFSIKAVEFALHGETENKIKAEEALQHLTEQLNNYVKHPDGSVNFKQRVFSKSETYIKVAHKYLEDTTAGEVSVKDVYNMEKQVHQIRRELIHALYPLIETEQQEFTDAANSTYAHIASASKVLLSAIVGVVIVALISGFLVARSITNPVQKLNDAARQIAMGDLKQEVNIRSADEVGELAVSFNHMRTELKKHHDRLEELVKERTIALENSNKELESYSYSIAHDLRAPLRSISGFSQIILEDAGHKLSSVDQGYLQRIINSASHMAELIDDILELSRVSRSHMQLDEVNLSNTCTDISKTLSSEDECRSVEWRIQPDVIVKGDQRLLYIVLSNLLGNAWKFTKQSSQALIEFGRKQDTNEHVYYVRDNGVGFDMQYVDTLFGLFKRLHRAEDYEGTGVGLATVQRIINRHKGWVKAEGEEGKGATVYFSIPQ